MAGVLKVYNAATSSWEDVINVAASQFTLVENQTPTGSINGTNKDFTLPTGFVASTLKVYKNGVRMKPGGDDYTATSTGFTMTTAPATGTVLLCDYALGDGTNVVGGNSLVSDEVPTGTVNGTNKVFTTARGYVGATLQVFINGVKQRRGADFVETTPSSGTFTMDEAPLTGDVIFVNYSYNLNPSSNADTVDGINANATPTANTLYPLDANAKLSNTIFATELGYAEVTSGQGSITTLADLTGLSTTVTVPSGATIIVEGWIPQLSSSVATDRADLYIREGSTSLAIAYGLAPASSSGWGGAYVRVRLQPTAGSHTYKLSLARGVGTGNVSTYADATTKAHIQVRVV